MTLHTAARQSIDPQRFCANESDIRSYLQQPWRRGAWVYATNGHIIVRVPAESAPDVPECAKAPNGAALFDPRFTGEGEFLLLPKLEKLKPCVCCEGSGRVRAIKCSSCDSTGEFFRNEFEYECKQCNDSAAGPGWCECYSADENSVIRPCNACDGLGHNMRRCGVVQIGDGTYSPVYLHWINELPQARVMPGSAAVGLRDTVPMAFIFDGGQGLLQPRKPD